MSTAGERMGLEAFLGEAGPRIDAEIGAARGRALSVAGYLASHVGKEPAIAAQLEKFQASLPASVGDATLAEREVAARAARRALADVKKRWIEAETPPLVSEIDDRLREISTELKALERPHTGQMAEAARRIDELSQAGRAVEGIEQRLALPALASAILFIAGVIFFFHPTILLAVPPLASFWTIIFCVGALPALAVYYAFATRPRARADAQIDQLNRTFFLPNGGIYFPPGPGEACVIPVEWTPPEEELPLDKAPRDPRKEQEKKGRWWW